MLAAELLTSEVRMPCAECTNRNQPVSSSVTTLAARTHSVTASTSTSPTAGVLLLHTNAAVNCVTEATHPLTATHLTIMHASNHVHISMPHARGKSCCLSKHIAGLTEPQHLAAAHDKPSCQLCESKSTQPPDMSQPKRSCADHQSVLSEVLGGRKAEGKDSFVLFVDTYKAFPTVWCGC
jgi:hypothetical protein